MRIRSFILPKATALWCLLVAPLCAQPAQDYVSAIGASPLQAPATADFAPGGNFTMEGWFFLTGNTPYGWLMGKGLATGGTDPFVSFTLQLNNDGTRALFVTSTGAAGSYRELAAPSALPLRTWVHLAAVMENGATTRLHVNGQLAATGSAAGAPLAAPTLRFGVGSAYLANGNTNYPGFPGYARQLRFWNVARTAAQIAAALGEALPTDRTGLVAAWPLDEGSGTTARDLSGNGRALTPSGGSLAANRTAVIAAGPFFTPGTTAVTDGSLVNVNDGQLIDFDSDGDLDLVLVQVFSPPTVPETRRRLRAFRNNNGTFVDVTDAVLGDVTMAHPRHNFVGDFNRDGRPDLLVVGHGTDTPPFPGEQAKLFIQSVDGRLVDESAARLPAHLSFTHNVAAGDIDGDGDLDIYMCNVNGGDSGPRFYLNNGAGVFTEATDRIPSDIANRTAGLSYTASLLVDVTADGFPELVLGGENSPINEILLNDGTGRFVRDSRFVLPPKILSPKASTVAIAAADFNGDGAPDLVLATTGGTELLPDGRTINGYGLAGLQLLLNRGDGRLYDATATAGFTWRSNERWVIWPRLIDLNGDGRIDIVAAVSTASSGVTARLFLNRGAALFTDISEAFAGVGSAGQFVHVADFNRDGRIDLVTANAVAVTTSLGVNALDPAVFQAGVPAFTAQPLSQAANAGASLSLTAPATAPAGGTAPTFQWQQNGSNLAGAATGTLTVANLQPGNTGLYTAIATSGGTVTSEPAIVGVATTAKVIGTGSEVGPDIQHANGNIYDQILLQGAAATITADPNQITRISYLDLTDDIVQVEFSGAGTLSLVLENPSGPAPPVKYNQPTVAYMKGHARIVISGANESTNVSVFSVGRITAVNQALFRDDVTYDGLADIASLSIQSANGRFGGARTANASYLATKGLTGIYAPGVQFSGPVFVGDMSAADAATPVLMVGAVSDARITGGDLLQANGQAVRVSGISQLQFAIGSTSHNVPLSAQPNRATLRENGTDVSTLIATGPGP